MRRLRRQEPRRMGDFRLIRCLPNDVNFRRLIVHVKRLKQRLADDQFFKKIRLRNRRGRLTKLSK